MNSQNIKTQKRSFLSTLFTTQKLLANFWGKLCFSKDPVRGETRTTVRASSINCSLFTAIATLLLLSACGSTNTTTTTKYDTEGNITETVVEESDTSDLAAYINAGDGNVTNLTGDISKFYLGYNGIGLSWLSVSGGRQKAPVNTDSNSAEALEKIADVVKAAKTTVVTETIGVNAEPSGSSATEADDSIAEEVENIEGEAEEETTESDIGE